MQYNPFQRGIHPVGVSTDSWTDSQRGRTLPVEIWYPAADHYNGKDLDPATWDTFVPSWVTEAEATPEVLAHQAAVKDAGWATGNGNDRPLVLLIHGWAGSRRESTFIATHLASHGYVVVAPDVTGSTYTDVDKFLTSQGPKGTPDDLQNHQRAIAYNRAGDIPFLISRATNTLPVRATGVGITGASFGGWSSLIAPTVDSRIDAIVPMCPANDDSLTVDDGDPVFGEQLQKDWISDPATLLLAADRDSLLPLYGQLALFRSLPATRKRMVVMERADHNHFVDDIDTGQQWLKEYAQRLAGLYPDGPGDWPRAARAIQPISVLTSGTSAKVAWQGLITAHFDAYLRQDPGAIVFQDGNTDARLAELGISTYTIDLAPVPVSPKLVPAP